MLWISAVPTTGSDKEVSQAKQTSVKLSPEAVQAKSQGESQKPAPG